MNKITWQSHRKFTEDMEGMTDQLLRGNRETNKSQNELSGWADRVMAWITKPAGNIDKYPIGHGTNYKGMGGGAPFKKDL